MYYTSTAAAIKKVDTNNTEYQRGYMDAMRRQHKREREQRRRREYFIKQRAVGLALLIITALCIPILDGDATVALVTVPMGLVMLLGNTMLIDNEYYREIEERKARRGRCS